MTKNARGYLITTILVTLALVAVAVSGWHYSQFAQAAPRGDRLDLYYINSHHQLSAPRDCWFDHESVGMAGRDLRVTWVDGPFPHEVFHYGHQTVTFDGVTFNNRTNKRAVVIVAVKCEHRIPAGDLHSDRN